jgi:Ca2+-binding EF-hand superfamily protein
MGACITSARIQSDLYHHGKFYALNPELKGMKSLFECLSLDESTIRCMHDVFTDIDKDNKGSIDKFGLLTYLQLEASTFNTRALTVFEVNGTANFGFKDFVLTLWNYCIVGKSTLTMFSFDVYDLDCTGIISPIKFESLLEDFFGIHYRDHSSARSILKDIERLGSSVIDLQMYHTLMKKHQGLLIPIFNIRSKLQERILGISFWNNLSNIRM